jgi:hypothetical protein
VILYAFDLYPRDDPKDGARLVRFSQLETAEYRGEANGTGAGKIVLRGNTTDAAFIDPLGLQYVRVVRINDALAEAVVGGFFLDNGDYEALSEKSTKKLTFGGAGTLSYLARAVMWSHSYIIQHPAVFDDTNSEPYDDLWRNYAQGLAVSGGDLLGAGLWRVVWEAQHFENPPVDADDRPETTIPALTMDFDGFTDSDGNDWTLPSGQFTAQVLDGLIDVTRRFMEAGLYVSMDPDTFVLSAWEAANHGRDRTGTSWGTDVVRFQAPTDGTTATGNIKSDAKRGLAASIRRSAILAGGQDIYATATAASDVPWEGGYRSDAVDVPALEQLATAQLDARSDAGDTVRLRMLLGDSPTTGKYLPWEQVRPDDTVTLHTGTGQWEWNEAAYHCEAVTVQLRPGGDWDAWVDLGSTYSSMESRAFQARSGTCSCPVPIRLCGGNLGSSDAVILDYNWDAGVAEPIPAIAVLGQPATDTGIGFHLDASPEGWAWHTNGTLRAMVTTTVYVNGPAIAGETYRFEANALDAGGELRVDWLGGGPWDGTSGVWTTIQTDTIAATTGSYADYSADLVAPAGAVALRLHSMSGQGLSVERVRCLLLGSGTEPDDPLLGTEPHGARCDHGHLIESLTTAETDDTLVLAPDGSGGVGFRAETGGVTDHGALTGLGDDDHPQYATDADLATHAAAADPHTGYQKESEKSAASGYASLDSGTHVPQAELGSGSGGAGTKVLYDDQTYKTPSAGFVNPMTTEGDLIRGGTSGAAGRLAVGTDGYALVSDGTDPVYEAQYAGAMAVIGNGVDVITTGAKGVIGPFPFACVITEVTLLEATSTSASIVLDLWLDTYANYAPTVADTITASAKPTLSSAIKSQDGTLSGWTTAIPAGSILKVNVDSVTAAKQVVMTLKVRRT